MGGDEKTGAGRDRPADEPARGGQRGADAGSDQGFQGGERDFGSSAGYGHGGSALDYREVTGEDPVPLPRPNPLDAVVKTGEGGREPKPE